MLPINILLVEDNPGDVFLISDFLQHSSKPPFQVTQVDSLQAAFEHLEHTAFDLALLDLDLPDSQGLNTLLKFQDQAPYLPIVVLTGLNDAIFAVQLIQQGAQDYLIKNELDQNWLRNTITYTVARSRWMSLQYQQGKSLRQSNQALQAQVHEYRAELARMNEQLQLREARAATDTLTGITNRYGFEQRLEQEWRYAQEGQRSLSLLMLEVIMDKCDASSLGEHDDRLWQEECLRQVARYLKTVFKRSRDLVARYEGKEFGVILPDTPKKKAVQIATELYNGINALAIRHPNPEMNNWVTIRFGVASGIPCLNTTPANFLTSALQGLYTAKTGREHWATLHTKGLEANLETDLALVSSTNRLLA
ncbi:MAG: diguanylate cyclase [Cyanobacteria bacterium P01_F01_bin.53]